MPLANKQRSDGPYWRNLKYADVSLANAYLTNLKTKWINEQKKLKDQPQLTSEPTGAGQKIRHDDASSASTDIASSISNLNISDSAQAKDLAEVQRRIKETGKSPVVDDTQYPRRCLLREPTTDVVTNHFKIDISDDATFYEYIFLDLPIRKSKTRLRSFIKEAINTIPFLKNSKDTLATDYINTVVSWGKLPKKTEDPRVSGDAEGSIHGPYEVVDNKRRKTTHQIHLKFVRKLNISGLRNYISGKDEENPRLWDSSPEVKCLNMVISKCFDQNEVFQLGGNKFFVADTEAKLGKSQSLCTMQGYYYTIKPAKGGVLLNVNSGTSAFYIKQTVEDFLNDSFTFRDEQKRRDALKAVRVHIDYARGKDKDAQAADIADPENRFKTIFGTSRSKQMKDLTFEAVDDNGKKYDRHVQEYLEKTYKYKFTAAEASQTGINLGNQRSPAWFSAVKLTIVENQIFKRPVPDHLTEHMLNLACKSPADHNRSIQNDVFKFLKVNGLTNLNNPTPVPFKNCPALRISPPLLTVPSTTLQYPVVRYTGEEVNLNNEKDQSSWNLKGRKFLDSGELLTNKSTPGPYCWFIYDPTQIQFKETSTEYIDSLTRQFQKYGIGKLQNQHKPTIVDKKLNDLTEITLRSTLQSLNSHPVEGGRLKIAFLLLPAKHAPTYQLFKDIADREFGLQTICLTERPNVKFNKVTKQEILKTSDQYFGNVMMKANLKFGGVNHSTKKVQDLLKNTLVLGADVTHPGIGAVEGCPSIAAIVGSVDDKGKFRGSMRLQDQDKKDREIIQYVKDMVVERLRDWIDNPTNFNKRQARLPDNILYYRDGVSEGQYSKVKNMELAAIEQAISQIQDEYDSNAKPKVTALVVVKRHHTRFFPIHHRDIEASTQNLLPGTLVDDVVTSPYFLDFFLQSHSGLKGTAKPTHYFCLQDEMGLGALELQNITHEICYTYVRATMGVSYASPAYYADRLCERGRAYLRDFLAGKRDVEAVLEAKKLEWEQELFDIRAASFPKTKDADGKWPRKTKEELVMEQIHGEQVQKKCREFTMAAALAVWAKARGGSVKHEEQKNPWNAKLDKTMFWM